MIVVSPPGLPLRNDPRATLSGRPALPAEPFKGMLSGGDPHPALTPGLETSLPAQVPASAVGGSAPPPKTDIAEAFDNVKPAAAHWEQEFAFTDLGMFGRYAALAAPAGAPMPLAVQASPLPLQEDPPLVQSAPAPAPAVSPTRATTAPAVPVTTAMPEIASSSRAVPVVTAKPVTTATPSPQPPNVLADVSSFSAAETQAGMSTDIADIVEEPSTPATAERPVPSAAVPTEGSAPPPVPEDAEGTAPLGSAARLPLRQPAPPTPASAVNLLVTGQGAAVSVAVRSAGDDAEDYARLRRLVEDVAAEFGVDVSDFRLNGSNTTPVFGTLIGGRNGSSTR